MTSSSVEQTETALSVRMRLREGTEVMLHSGILREAQSLFCLSMNMMLLLKNRLGELEFLCIRMETR